MAVNKYIILSRGGPFEEWWDAMGFTPEDLEEEDTLKAIDRAFHRAQKVWKLIGAVAEEVQASPDPDEPVLVFGVAQKRVTLPVVLGGEIIDLTLVPSGYSWHHKFLRCHTPWVLLWDFKYGIPIQASEWIRRVVLSVAQEFPTVVLPAVEFWNRVLERLYQELLDPHNADALYSFPIHLWEEELCRRGYVIEGSVTRRDVQKFVIGKML